MRRDTSKSGLGSENHRQSLVTVRTHTHTPTQTHMQQIVSIYFVFVSRRRDKKNKFISVYINHIDSTDLFVQTKKACNLISYQINLDYIVTAATTVDVMTLVMKEELEGRAVRVCSGLKAVFSFVLCSVLLQIMNARTRMQRSVSKQHILNHHCTSYCINGSHRMFTIYSVCLLSTCTVNGL